MSGSDLSQIVNQQQLTNELLASIQQQLVRWNATWQAGLVDTLNPNLSNSPAGTLRVTPLAQTQSSPADPAGILFAGGTVMMGLAGTITPLVTGKVLLILSGTIFNAGGAGDGALVQLRHGTGAAPANAAAAAGTAVGGVQRFVNALGAEKVPFCLNAFVTGLSLAAHWIDVTLAATTAGTANITDVSISAVELE